MTHEEGRLRLLADKAVVGEIRLMPSDQDAIGWGLAELDRLRALVARLVDIEPVEWCGQASDDARCSWCGESLPDDEIVAMQQFGRFDPARHRPNCAWMAGKGEGG